MEKEQIKEAMLWYKRKLAVTEDINIEDIKEEDIENIEVLKEIHTTSKNQLND